MCHQAKLHLPASEAGLWDSLLDEIKDWGQEGCGCMIVNRGLILPKEKKIEEIRVELSLGPISFFKHQTVQTSGYWESTYSHFSDARRWEVY